MAEERIFAIRGAISPVQDTVEGITDSAITLIKEMIAENNLGIGNRIVAAIIGSTSDITACYPATAIRQSGICDAPLFSVAEPNIKGGMPHTIRVMIFATFGESDPKIKHIYLNDAKKLRPDLDGADNGFSAKKEDK